LARNPLQKNKKCVRFCKCVLLCLCLSSYSQNERNYLTTLASPYHIQKVDVTVELVEELQTKTKEYLQPNPTARARMQAVKGISKLSGQAKSNTYPQPEGTLADCMLLYGKKLGDDSYFAQSLIEFGDSLKQVADIKYSLDDRVKQNFLEPLHQLQTKDLKEVMVSFTINT
jgi:BAR domain